MTSKEILNKYLEFYKNRGHKQVPNVSLIPEGDSTLLFVNSGMFPLVPYLSGQPHPLGKRLVNVQRAGRFQEDLDEVGDNRHTTAFHMIGNWSLGDYFKKEQLPWVYEFLVEEIKLDPKRLFATVFIGDEYAGRDTESIEIIKQVFKKYGIEAKEDVRIYACGRDKNWWQRGDAPGELGGPDSEIYYYLGEGNGEGKNPSQFEDEFLEIGNSVFMQYFKNDQGGWTELPQKNVDFGGGLERIVMVAQGKHDIFETDMFWPLIEKIQELSSHNYYENAQTTRAMRIIADHMRGATFMAMDGVTPSNKDQGYMLRRLLRRMVRAARSLGIQKDVSVNLVDTVVSTFSWLYPQLNEKKKEITEIFADEENKFFNTLKHGAAFVEKTIQNKNLSTEELAKKAFELYQSLGYPGEIFLAEVKEKGFSLNEKEFNKVFQDTFNAHQDVSRAGMEKKFKGGLADTQEITIAYHTTTHLLQYALKKVLGDHVCQIGSNNSAERLRFDFPNETKPTEAQLKEVEKIINDAISAGYPVNFEIKPKAEAINSGAIYLKHESYPDPVKVYFIGESYDKAISKEFCGGPHVQNTREIKPVEIFKSETIGKGKQRVYARFKAN